MKDKFTALICKVSGNRFLNVLRDSFVLVASLTLIAGFAIMISSVFIDPNGIIFGSSGLGLGEMIFGSEKEFLASGFAQMLVQGQNIFNFFQILLVFPVLNGKHHSHTPLKLRLHLHLCPTAPQQTDIPMEVEWFADTHCCSAQ